MVILICIFYLITIIAANLAISFYGPWTIPYTSFILIPFDFCTRDYLHERWQGKYFWLKMTSLIFLGSILSLILNYSVKNIAIASFIAFICSGFIDTIAYQILYKQSAFIKINGSNFFSTIVDSILFPYLAFSMFDLKLTITQIVLKFGGGILWSKILIKYLFK